MWQSIKTSWWPAVCGLLALICEGSAMAGLLPEDYQGAMRGVCMVLVSLGLIGAKQANKTNAPEPTATAQKVPPKEGNGNGTGVKALVLFMLVPALMAGGCYHNPRTWVERDGHLARQYHVNGHGWTEQAIITPSECDWVDLLVSPIDGMEYCPPRHRGTETTGMHVAQSTFDTVVPAVIHGLAFVAAFGVGAALMPATQITQSVGGTSVTGSSIRTSTLVLPGGAVPGGVAP